MLTNGRRRCEIARGVNGSPLPRHQTASRLSDVLQRAGLAMRMGATMMRHGSDQYLPAAMSGMIICMLLLGAILVRSSVGLAERRGRVITVSEHSQAPTRTPENGDRVTQDIGLRGSLP